MDNKNYYYNLGRAVALVEVMNDLEPTFPGKVFDNAFSYLPYHLTKALFKEKHRLHSELLEPANVVLRQGEIPHGIMTAYDKGGSYALGYQDEKAYIRRMEQREQAETDSK